MVMINGRKLGMLTAPFLLAGVLFPLVTVAQSSGSTPPQDGTLSNFDVFNDTGQATHGFEIELDGIDPSQVTYEFGAPYERYGNPTVTAIPGGTLVTYASPYDAASKTWAAATPLAPNPITPTLGHACWTGGSPNYPTAGCEHFGLGLTGTPTNVVYNWLVADPAAPGNLIVANGPSVSVPAPAWNVQPAPPAAANQQPVVQAVVAAPDDQPDAQLGTAMWVKVSSTQSPSKADLGHLVPGDKEDPPQVETEWALLQPGAGGSLTSQLADQVQMGAKNVSIVKRYEYSAYTGAYDPENHEALPVNDSNPVKTDLGNLIGDQNVALHLAGGPAADVVPPVAKITTKSPGTTKTKSLAVAFSATDNVSKAFTFSCSLDKHIPAPCKSGKVFSPLAVGTHTLVVYAADAANNASRPVSLTWKVTK